MSFSPRRPWVRAHVRFVTDEVALGQTEARQRSQLHRDTVSAHRNHKSNRVYQLGLVTQKITNKPKVISGKTELRV